MRVINSITRRDVTGDYILFLEGKLTSAEFEIIAGINEKINTKLIRNTIDNITE
tara:strand:+ start:773 stop:934 length:162 start_codon:yes stop_codon:yes gene_type:complete